LSTSVNRNNQLYDFTDDFKASANHEKIASSFGEALSRISVHVVACEKEARLHRTKSMQEKIVKLYAHIFLYLEDTMEWYQKRSRTHFREAFRQNFNDKFESTIVNIQNLSLDVLREANVTSMAETRQIRLTAEETLDELKFGQMDARLSLDSVARKLAEMEYQNKQLRLELRREAEERQQLEFNKTIRLEEFRNSLVSQIGTGMRHELERVAQNMLTDGIWDVPGECAGELVNLRLKETRSTPPYCKLYQQFRSRHNGDSNLSTTRLGPMFKPPTQLLLGRIARAALLSPIQRPHPRPERLLSPERMDYRVQDQSSRHRRPSPTWP
jgi:hypothetical protein